MKISWSTNKNEDFDKSFFSIFWSAFNKDGSSGILEILIGKWHLEFAAKYCMDWGHNYWKSKGWYYTDRFFPLPFYKYDGKWWGGIYFSLRLRCKDRVIKMNDIKKTRQFAEDAHKDQKYGEHPYSYHLEHVHSTLHYFGVTDEALLCSAWLHDTIEDTRVTYEKLEEVFNKDVADLVFVVTNEEGKNRKERNAKTYPKIKNSLRGTILKLADRIANTVESMNSNKGLLEMYRKEYPSFKEGVYNPEFKDETLKKMWDHLDSLMRVGE